MAQVITIKADGSLAGLQHKKGKGIDLRGIGRASINRVTQILFDEKSQTWFIEWTAHVRLGSKGALCGVWDDDLALQYGVDCSSYGCVIADDNCLTFKDYEDAVSLEVAVIQSIQKKGEGEKVFG